MPVDCLFLPKLRRRKQYPTKSNGEYYASHGDYRQEIRQDCLGRCVYCDLHENEMSGQTVMEIDHFRPKDKFPKLANNPHNLVWSCPTCNNRKSNDWPALNPKDTFVGNEGFIDPFKENRLDYFKVQSDGAIIPLKPPAEYIVELLRLNRRVPRRARELRYEAYEHVRKFEKDIARLEKLNSRSNEQAAKLSKLRKLKDHIQARLDFSLRDD